MPTPFTTTVIDIVQAIPSGQVATYGEVATWLGKPAAARAVGRVLRTLANPEQVPWHRVINAKGRISMGGTPGRAHLQRSRLQAEGVRFENNQINREQFGWRPSVDQVEQWIAEHDTLASKC